MRTPCLPAVLTIAMAAFAAHAQAQATNHALTPVHPIAPDPGRPGQVIPLPGGGNGTVIGGTPYFQTLQIPGGGTAIVVPHGNGTSIVIDPDGHGGIIRSP